MSIEIESFPHPGEHCDNDLHLAHVTLWALAIFVVAFASTIVAWLSSY